MIRAIPLTALLSVACVNHSLMAGDPCSSAQETCSPTCSGSNCQPATSRVIVREYRDDTFASNLNPLGNESNKEVVYSIDLGADGALQPGEILLVMGELMVEQMEEATKVNPSTMIYLGRCPTWHDNDDTALVQITEPNGTNLQMDDDLVKDTRVKVGTYVVPDCLDEYRRYVNFVAYVNQPAPPDPLPDVNVLENRGQLSVIRITPVDAKYAGSVWTVEHRNSGHGGELVPPGPSPKSIPSGSVKKVVYSVELPNGVRSGDIIVALGECYGKYEGSTTTQFHSQLTLEDSASGTTGIQITAQNRFDLIDGIQPKRAAVKVGAYKATSHLNGAHYVNYVAWSDNGIDKVDDESGRLAVLHFRVATLLDTPVAVQQYDSCSNSEQICRLPDNDEEAVVYTQQLCSLAAGETLLAVSEMSATSQDIGVLKRLSSTMRLADSATATTASCSACNLTEGNAVTVIKDPIHHVLQQKVGAVTVPSGISGTKYLNRILWSDEGFDGNCGNGHSCTNACCENDDCPQFGGAGTNCDGDNSCDLIYRDYGRLSILRFTPLNSIGFEKATQGDTAVIAVLTKLGTDCENCPEDVNRDGLIDSNDLIRVLQAN